MFEQPRYSIGQIAKLLEIPTSTLRYWEQKEVFATKRNLENDYREFDCQATIELMDIVFYRNLNVPIEKMKNFSHLNPEAVYTILEDTEQQVQAELVELQQKLTGIARRKQQLENLFSLREQRYQQEPLPIEKIVTFESNNPEDIKLHLAGPEKFALVQNQLTDQQLYLGLVVPQTHQSNNHVLWEKATGGTKTYVTCLLEGDAEDIALNNLASHQATLKKAGYQVQQMVAHYLATLATDPLPPVDYYKAWLEIMPLEKENCPNKKHMTLPL